MHKNEEQVKERYFYQLHIMWRRMLGTVPSVVDTQQPKTFAMVQAFAMYLYH
jgi:hypothetical protein